MRVGFAYFFEFHEALSIFSNWKVCSCCCCCYDMIGLCAVYLGIIVVEGLLLYLLWTSIVDCSVGGLLSVLAICQFFAWPLSMQFEMLEKLAKY